MARKRCPAVTVSVAVPPGGVPAAIEVTSCVFVLEPGADGGVSDAVREEREKKAADGSNQFESSHRSKATVASYDEVIPIVD
jgi:hypothetical protein